MKARASPDTAEVELKEVERSIFHHTNRARKRHGLRPLVTHNGLLAAARSHSQWMARNKFSHKGIYGTQPYQRARNSGFPSQYVGENISYHPVGNRGKGQTQKDKDWKLGADAVKHWMDSPGHRANILNGSFNRIGIGAYQHRGRVYLTQNFGNAPRPTQPKSATKAAEREDKVWDMIVMVVSVFLTGGVILGVCYILSLLMT